MTNYKQFYNSWIGFAKPKRQLLLERTHIDAAIRPDDFLALTTDEETLRDIENDPYIKGEFDLKKMSSIPSLSIELDDFGNGKVINHEGRNRAFAAKQSGIERLPVVILVTNKDGVSFGQIKQFTGQYTPVVVRRIRLQTRESNINTQDPIEIGESTSQNGYFIRNQGNIDTQASGIQPFLKKKFITITRLYTAGYDNYVNVINDAYVIVDSSGNQYSIEKNRDYPTLERQSSLYHFNLTPHPAKVHGGIEQANQQTYTIKKK